MRKIGKKDLFVVGAVVVLVAVALSSGTSWAFNLGGGGSTTGSDLYKLIVTDFIQGPIGTAAGVAFIVVGAAMAVMGKITSAIWPLLGGGMLALSDKIAQSLGMLF